MNFQRKNGQGTLFINDRKTSDKQPDLNGTILINGTEANIAAWRKTSKSGKEYYSVQVSPKQQQLPQYGGQQYVPQYAQQAPIQPMQQPPMQYQQAVPPQQNSGLPF
jgi:hypothetical protein